MPASFGSKLNKAFATHGQLCVGIDPHAALLSDWNLPDSVAGLKEFSNAVLDAAVGRVGIIKPQVSFFERHGSAGYAVLEDLLQKAQSTDLVVIMDIKRGDIGTTMDAYFDAWLGKTAPFACDAITVSPYLGFDSLKPFCAEALERGKGVFVLAATSNPEGAALQQALQGDKPVAANIWDELGKLNKLTGIPGEQGSFGAVVGATLKLRKFGLEAVTSEQPEIGTPILAPGFGAQGARLEDIENLFGGSTKNVIASVSRSVLQAGAFAIDESIESAVAALAIGIDA